jgi:hypothetical protein
VNEWYTHRAQEIFFPALVINGQTIIENDRLKILNEPELNEEAVKYGDPDHLLNEEWVPRSPPAA